MYAFFGDDLQPEGITLHACHRLCLNIPTIAAGEADATKDAQRVVIIGEVGIGRRADNVVTDVVHTIARDVDDFIHRDIAIECIDCQVAAQAVILYGTERRLRVAT